MGLTGLLIAAFAGRGVAAAAPVPLGTTASFSVLAGSGITNTGSTTLFGDIGTFPTTSITGLSDITLGGVNHGGDAVTQGAKNDLVTAYNAAAGALPPDLVTADLGGRTLVPGIYKATSSMGLTGAVTLDAGGDLNAVFIFQAGSTLTTASDSSVVLLNGAQACNVFWQVGSSATLGTSSVFVGTVMALTSITADTSATVDGRLLARTGAVTLAGNTVTENCSTGDVVAAAVMISSPTDGDEFTVPSADDSIDIVVTGTGERGATVVVTLPGGGEETVTVEDDGSWPVTFTEVPVGSHTVTAVQTTDSEETSSATVDFSVVVEAAADADTDADGDAAAGADSDADTDAASGAGDGPVLSRTGFEGALYGGSAVLLLLAGVGLFAVSRKPRTSSGH